MRVDFKVTSDQVVIRVFQECCHVGLDVDESSSPVACGLGRVEDGVEQQWSWHLGK